VRKYRRKIKDIFNRMDRICRMGRKYPSFFNKNALTDKKERDRIIQVLSCLSCPSCLNSPQCPL
jgi:hypothetical protein